MKVSFVQFSPELGKVSTNIKKIESFSQEFQDADLVVLPELCNSGYNFKNSKQARANSEEIIKSKFIEHLISISKKYNLHIVTGFNERDGDDLYNSAILVGPKGYIGSYRKLHLFMKEREFFKSGNRGLPVFDIGICRVGILVCFDWMFPEVWRILALKGADIICHPSNLILPGLAQKAIPAHSLTNRLFIVTANRIGTEGNLSFTGLSTIADPTGEVLYQASESREEVKVINIDISLARNKDITTMNHIFKDRRPDEYKKLVES
jgi:predicted amidohydrolase